MKDDSFIEFIMDQLAELGGVNCRAMFGGCGLYHWGTFFGIIHKGRLYFKTNQDTRSEYIEQGMGPFRPNEKQTLKNYYEVPADVIENQGQLAGWAEKAISGKRPLS